MRLVGTEEELEPALRAALVLDDRVLVEQVVVGREVGVAVLDDPDGGRRVGPPLEILVHDGLFDTATKYDGSAAYVIPAQLTETEAKAPTDSALRVYDALGCRGIARVDFFLTLDGLVLNEVNTTPGMTAESQVPKMFAADGLTYPEFLDRLIGRRRGSSGECLEWTDRWPRRVAGIAILLVMLRHAFPDTFPGAGVVGFGSVGWCGWGAGSAGWGLRHSTRSPAWSPGLRRRPAGVRCAGCSSAPACRGCGRTAGCTTSSPKRPGHPIGWVGSWPDWHRVAGAGRPAGAADSRRRAVQAPWPQGVDGVVVSRRGGQGPEGGRLRQLCRPVGYADPRAGGRPG